MPQGPRAVGTSQKARAYCPPSFVCLVFSRRGADLRLVPMQVLDNIRKSSSLDDVFTKMLKKLRSHLVTI